MYADLITQRRTSGDLGQPSSGDMLPTIIPADVLNDTVSDVCSPNPCLNGGICVPDGPDVRCICFGDYSGPVCESVDNVVKSGSGSGDFVTDAPFADWKDTHSFSGELSYPSYSSEMTDTSGALWTSVPTGETSKAVFTTSSILCTNWLSFNAVTTK